MQSSILVAQQGDFGIFNTIMSMTLRSNMVLTWQDILMGEILLCCQYKVWGESAPLGEVEVVSGYYASERYSGYFPYKRGYQGAYILNGI